MQDDERQRLVDKLAGSLAQVSRPDGIEHSIDRFRKADAEYGRRLAAGVASRRRRARLTERHRGHRAMAGTRG